MKQTKRWTYVIYGIIVMLFAGLIYGWSVYQAAMAEDFPDWSASQFSMNFSICMTFFCIGAMASGTLSKKVSVRLLILIASAALLAGFLLTSKTQNPPMLYIGYGVLSGFAIGIVYNAILSSILKWFPDKAGFVSGILLMGFGFSAMLIGPLFTCLSNLFTWRAAFAFMGIIVAIVFAAGAMLIKAPSEEYQADKQTNGINNAVSLEEARPGQMLKRPAFWAYFIWAICLSGAGLAINSNSYNMAEQTLFLDEGIKNAPILADKLSILVALFSVFNGVGRIIFGAVFDRFGRRSCMNLINICFVLSAGVMFFALWKNLFLLILAGLICCGFSYGGVMPSNSAFTRFSFGQENYPLNFSIITLNLLPAAYLGPLLSGILYDIGQSYMGTLICLIIFTVVGIICAGVITFVEHTRQKQRQ